MIAIGRACNLALLARTFDEKIDFIWYLKKISLLVLVGYLTGAFVFWVMTV